KGKPVERIDDLAGMASEDGKYALAMAVLLLAMTGIPPLSGFFGKLYVFLAAIRSGLDVLAVIGVATSAISAFYYLRIIKVMYFDAGSPGFDRRTTGMNLVIGVSAVVTALFVFYPSPLSTATTYAAHALFQSAGF
ncbi:MAG TPA: proton-conducting transporter membrane subunit, partial [Acidiphilium sp.]